MPWGPRVAETSPSSAEGDKLFFYAIYNDVSGALFAGLPVCKDLSDSSEYETAFVPTSLTSTELTAYTAQTAGPLQGQFIPTTLTTAGTGYRSAGMAVLSTNIQSGGVSGGDIPARWGIFNPETVGSRPNRGDLIRVQRTGVCPVAISGGQAPNVGDYVLVQKAQQFALIQSRTSGISTPNQDYLGRVTATTSQISVGQAPTLTQQLLPPAGNIATNTGVYYVNAWIDL